MHQVFKQFSAQSLWALSMFSVRKLWRNHKQLSDLIVKFLIAVKKTQYVTLFAVVMLTVCIDYTVEVRSSQLVWNIYESKDFNAYEQILAR
jgi:hypothetical protein